MNAKYTDAVNKHKSRMMVAWNYLHVDTLTIFSPASCERNSPILCTAKWSVSLQISYISSSNSLTRRNDSHVSSYATFSQQITMHISIIFFRILGYFFQNLSHKHRIYFWQHFTTQEHQTCKTHSIFNGKRSTIAVKQPNNTINFIWLMKQMHEHCWSSAKHQPLIPFANLAVLRWTECLVCK